MGERKGDKSLFIGTNFDAETGQEFNHDTGFIPERMTDAFEQRLAKNIADYWARRGASVKPTVRQIPLGKSDTVRTKVAKQTICVVRSDMENGYPQGWRL